jgi:general secretion pathway protein K
MALIAVLWLVAAMSLIITGVVRSVRIELSTVGAQRQMTLAYAQADALILLALQSLQTKGPLPKTIQRIPVKFNGLDSSVTLQPLNGFIDINKAPLTLLAEMFRIAGGLSPSAAQDLAQATVEFRQTKNTKGNTKGFDSVEDLLGVPGLTYGVYANIVGLITADLRAGSGRINPMAAPAGVLNILAGGDNARANALLASRNADSNMLDTSFLKPEFVEAASTPNIKLQLEVDLPDGGKVQRAWFVYWGADPRSGLPWRVLGVQQSGGLIARHD